MCRLRTAFLPHPALRLISLRAQRGNPVSRAAPNGALIYSLDCFVISFLAMTLFLEHTKFPSGGGVSARTGWSRECVIIKLPKDHLPAARYSSTGGELATFQHVCRLRTASLPHPALRLDSLRAQRGNPVSRAAPSGALLIHWIASSFHSSQ